MNKTKPSLIVLLVALVLIIAGCRDKRILDFEYVFELRDCPYAGREVVTIEIDKWMTTKENSANIGAKMGASYLLLNQLPVFIKEPR